MVPLEWGSVDCKLRYTLQIANFCKICILFFIISLNTTPRNRRKRAAKMHRVEALLKQLQAGVPVSKQDIVGAQAMEVRHAHLPTSAPSSLAAARAPHMLRLLYDKLWFL